MSDGLPENWAVMRQQNRQSMVARVRQGQQHTEMVVNIINRVCDLSDRFHRQKAKIGSDVKLSSAGQQAALASLVCSELMPQMAQATHFVRKTQKYVGSKRSALHHPIKVDRTDAVGELRRQEIRTFLRSVAPGERVSLARQFIEDDAGAAAILDAQPVLAGLPENVHGQLREAVAQRVHGPALAELAGIEADYGNAQAMADVLLNELSAASGLTAKAFSEEMASHEAAADA